MLIVTCWCLILCRQDLRDRRLPNGLTLGGAVVALTWRFGYGGVSMGADGVAAAFLAGAFLLLPFLLHGAGGGDVKMLFAAGAVTGCGALMHLLWFTSVAGLVYGGTMLIAGALDGARVRHCARCVFDLRYDRKSGAGRLPPRDSESGRIPFSIPIAIGLIMSLAWT